MSNPEDRDLWERDEATPSDFAAAGPSGAAEGVSAPERPELHPCSPQAVYGDSGDVRPDGDARVARWAKAAEDAGTYMMGAMAEATVGVRDADDWEGPASVEAAATFLVPVADGELAELRAENSRMIRDYAELAAEAERLRADTDDAWLAVSEVCDEQDESTTLAGYVRFIARQRDAAEATLRAVEALADEWASSETPLIADLGRDLRRAVLDSHPTGTPDPTPNTGEACNCGAPEAYSLNPAEVVTHRTDGPCTVGPAGERPKRHRHSRGILQCTHLDGDCCVDCCEPGGAFETPAASSVDDKAGEGRG